MTIQVKGILRSPTGKPLPDTEIRVIATAGSLLVLSDAHAVETTDSLGAYDFPLEDGTYIIDVLYDDEAMIAGSSIVNAGTPTPVTLSELFLYTTPLNPQLVIDLQAEFQLLIDNLQNAFDTEKQEIRQQLIDGDASTLQTAQTFTNDRLGAEMAVITAVVTAGDAAVLNQSTAYTDTAGNLLAADITKVTADTASALFQITASIDSQGIENASIRTAIAAGIITAISTATATSNTTTGDLQVLLTTIINAGDASILQQSGINAQSLNDATEAFLLDQLIISGQGSIAGYEAYTLAALGFLDSATGLWVDGPLSSAFRAHTVSTADGGYASITDIMTATATPDGTLVVKGSLISDVNGRITGYRHSNDGVTTNFQIIADNFSVGHMDGAAYVADLSYDTVSKELRMNGNAIIAGSLSADALVANSITGGHIQADTIKSTHIGADTILGTNIKAATTILVGPEYTNSTYRSMTIGFTSIPAGGFVRGYYYSNDTGRYGTFTGIGIYDVSVHEIYTENHDSLGIGTRVVFNNPINRANVDLIILVNGVEHNLGLVLGDGKSFYAAGLDLFLGFFTGESVDIQFKDNDVGVINNLIAGINGVDDGTGQGTDTIRFWSGAIASQAHLANFRVYNNGNVVTKGNLDVEGTMTVGLNASGSDYVKLYGGNAVGSTQDFLKVQDGGKTRVRWQYDGRLIMYKTDGVTPGIDFNPISGVYEFAGKVTADGGVFGAIAVVATGEVNILGLYNESATSTYGLWEGGTSLSHNDLPLYKRQVIPTEGGGPGSSTGVALIFNTGYTAAQFFDNTRQFTAVISRGGSWFYRSGYEGTATTGATVEVIPFQLVTGGPIGKDALIYLRVRFYTHFMAPDTSAVLKWKLMENLLNE